MCLFMHRALPVVGTGILTNFGEVKGEVVLSPCTPARTAHKRKNIVFSDGGLKEHTQNILQANMGQSSKGRGGAVTRSATNVTHGWDRRCVPSDPRFKLKKELQSVFGTGGTVFVSACARARTRTRNNAGGHARNGSSSLLYATH